MRLDFNVLWIDDQPDHVQSYRARIDYLIRKEGFRLQSKFAKSVDEAKKDLALDIYGDHIDLILMDYDLGAGKKGDEGLLDIRNSFPFKDIIFYSAQAADLSGMVAAKKIQGIFCSDREGLPDTVNGVFDALVKKVLDIDHSRGIIMGSSSDIDGLVLDCLSAKCAKEADALPAHAREVISARVMEIRERFEKEAKQVLDAAKVADLHDLHYVYTAVDRLKLLRKILESDTNTVDVCNSIKSYICDTIPQRNKLAHVRVKREGFSRKLIDNKGVELTSDEMRKLRQSLLEYQEVMEKLLATLNA